MAVAYKLAACTKSPSFYFQLTLGMPELQAIVGMTTMVGGVSAQQGHVRPPAWPS